MYVMVVCVSDAIILRPQQSNIDTWGAIESSWPCEYPDYCLVGNIVSRWHDCSEMFSSNVYCSISRTVCVNRIPSPNVSPILTREIANDRR